MQRLTHELEMYQVNEHRRENCVHYDTCLAEASALQWPSFSCKGCRNFSLSPTHSLLSYERAATPLAWDV